jgi:hypothetical protein
MSRRGAQHQLLLLATSVGTAALRYSYNLSCFNSCLVPALHRYRLRPIYSNFDTLIQREAAATVFLVLLGYFELPLRPVHDIGKSACSVSLGSLLQVR